MITTNQTFRAIGAIALSLEDNQSVNIENAEERNLYLGNLMTCFVEYGFSVDGITSLVTIIDNYIVRVKPFFLTIVNMIEAIVPMIDQLVEDLDSVELDDKQTEEHIIADSEHHDAGANAHWNEKTGHEERMKQINNLNEYFDMIKERADKINSIHNKLK